METTEQAAWDQRYSGPDLVWGAGPNRFVADEVATLPPGRAIGLGTGEGRNAICSRSTAGGVRHLAADGLPPGGGRRVPGAVWVPWDQWRGIADFGPCVHGAWRGLPEGMFASGERVLPVSFDAAASRLAAMVRGGFLSEVSGSVYQDGMEYLLRVGPLGAAPGVSRLVRVRFTESARRDKTITVGLRWEATGVTGGLFPALDADIRLCDEGKSRVRVLLAGSYRPPLGALGAGLDRLVLHTIVTATIKTLLASIAAALENTPAGAAGPTAP